MRPGAERASMGGVNEPGVPQVDIADVPLTFEGSAILLDVREDDEWHSGHAADAQHIPMSQIPARIAEIDRDAELYVICKVGGRSQRVAQYLAQNGYTPVNVTGGMLAWAAAGRPVVGADGAPGTV
jgi:rhodanese-related sulfurtransferase